MRQKGSSTSIARASMAGNVWPVAALYGAITAAAAAFGAWLAAWVSGAARPWAVLDWVAEHALWGTLFGALLALVVRLGARFDPLLRDAGRRRAATARLSAACVALALLALAGGLAGPRSASWGRALPALVGAGLALTAAWTLLGRGLAGRARFQVLPSLDPARVAALIALLTLPLAPGVRHAPRDGAQVRPDAGIQASLVRRSTRPTQAPESLIGAWRVMLGR